MIFSSPADASNRLLRGTGFGAADVADGSLVASQYLSRRTRSDCRADFSNGTTAPVNVPVSLFS